MPFVFGKLTDFLDWAGEVLFGGRAEPGPEDSDEQITPVEKLPIDQILWVSPLDGLAMCLDSHRFDEDRPVHRVGGVPIVDDTTRLLSLFIDVARAGDEDSYEDPLLHRHSPCLLSSVIFGLFRLLVGKDRSRGSRTSA